MRRRRPPRRQRPPVVRTLNVKKLTAWRRERGLTLTQVQELTGIGRSTLCDFEQGRTVLQLHKLLALIRLYELDLFDLAELFRLPVVSPGHMRLFRHACGQTGCSTQEALEDLIVRFYLENSSVAHHLDK
ncbi:MAG: helix-turn-helix domain-containing protein [Desulfobaccales bacterium]